MTEKDFADFEKNQKEDYSNAIREIEFDINYKTLRGSAI